jgi:hypothetical protein
MKVKLRSWFPTVKTEAEIEISDEIMSLLQDYDLMLRIPKGESKPLASLDERGGRFRQR